MSNKVFYDQDARDRLLKGAEILYKAVKTTMGPKGRNVVLSQGPMPVVTHDGVTVARGINIPDIDNAEGDNLGYKTGANLIKEAASKLNDLAGDGTTTVTVLTYHILAEANKLIAAGHNPMELRKGLESACTMVLDKLRTLSEDIEGDTKRIAQVGTISAGDSKIGELIAGVMEKIGKDGIVTVERSNGLELEAEVVEGFTFDRGFISPYMVTDTTRMEAVYDKPAILVTDKLISSLEDFFPLLEKIAQSGRKNLLIIAEDVQGEALATVVLNKLKGIHFTVAVKAPSFGDRRKEVLRDIATWTGGMMISQDEDHSFVNVELDMLGTAQKVIVTKEQTTIVGGAGPAEIVKERLDSITAQIESAGSEYEKEQLELRRGALSGHVAVIKVGGASDTEIEEKKFRVDDAVSAVKGALAEGVVLGGGVTLLKLAQEIQSGALSPGASILAEALQQPFRILLSNAGMNPDKWLPIVLDGDENEGIDVTDDNGTIDLKEAGILDPSRVTREAILNSVSIAGTAITMEALVVELPEENKAPNMGMPMGMPPGMM